MRLPCNVPDPHNEKREFINTCILALFIFAISHVFLWLVLPICIVINFLKDWMKLMYCKMNLLSNGCTSKRRKGGREVSKFSVHPCDCPSKRECKKGSKYLVMMQQCVRRCVMKTEDIGNFHLISWIIRTACTKKREAYGLSWVFLVSRTIGEVKVMETVGPHLLHPSLWKANGWTDEGLK